MKETTKYEREEEEKIDRLGFYVRVRNKKKELWICHPFSCCVTLVHTPRIHCFLCCCRSRSLLFFFPSFSYFLMQTHMRAFAIAHLSCSFPGTTTGSLQILVGYSFVYAVCDWLCGSAYERPLAPSHRLFFFSSNDFYIHTNNIFFFISFLFLYYYCWWLVKGRFYAKSLTQAELSRQNETNWNEMKQTNNQTNKQTNIQWIIQLENDRTVGFKQAINVHK